MLKKLTNYLTTLVSCSRSSKQNIPQTIDNSERIVRSIFSPLNLSKDFKSINHNAFKPPYNSDEISVNRLNYTTPDFCKNISKNMEKPEDRKSYFGLALLYGSKIRECEAEIVYSPIDTNKFHADIKIGHMVERGVPLPAEINYKIKKIANSAKLFEDPSPNSLNWKGDEII